MSKTFKSFLGENGSRRLHVDRRPEGTNLWVSDNSWESDYGITIAPSEAPALALAILEAAGVTEADSPYMHEAADNLRAYILIEEKVSAEARERAELEAEALELLNAHREATGNPLAESLDGLLYNAKETWLAVARRARELAKEATK